MAGDVVEPSAVISPRGQVVAGGSRQSFYETYNTRTMGGGGGMPPPPPQISGSNPPPVIPGTATDERITSIIVRLPGGGQRAETPDFLPKFLGSRQIILFAWVAAMGMVSLDEWHTYGILPRPARLWDTSLTFILIAAVSSFDPLVPICSIFAIGLVITLAYQYYNGGGQFGSYGVGEAFAAAANPSQQ